MRNIIILILVFCSNLLVSAQNFDSYFENKTLRLDYIFSGTSTEDHVALHKLVIQNGEQWVGKRNNLSDLIRLGNGQIIVSDLETNEIIYKDTFSSLFQEWQSTNEAQTTTRSFENTFLVPYPKKGVNIELLFRSKDGEYRQVLKHKIAPDDILISAPNANPKYSEIHKGTEIDKAINVVIVPEGFTEAEMPSFLRYANQTVSAIFDHEPFGEYKKRFNFFALQTSSKNSGVSIPREKVWKQTLVSSHFDTFYSDRYLTTSHVFDLHDALIGVPYSHIIILANTDTYGGGGIFNSYTLTTTKHSNFEPVVVHEFGHSFAGLADEYFYEGGDVFDTMYSLNIEPWEPNITTLTDFNSKWKDLLNANTPIPTPISNKYTKKESVGVFEGAGYISKGMYRPAIDCRMHTNASKHFCPACQKAIKQIINFYTQ